MGKNISVSADMFGYAFNELIDGIEAGIDKALAPAVKKGCSEGKKATISKASSYWGGSSYPYGFSYHVDKSSMLAKGEVGHPTKPGLVHLLEKGHAKVGGGSTRAFPHMEDGYQAGQVAFEEKLLEGLDSALS